MEIIEVDAAKYTEVIRSSYNIFNSAIFNDFNKQNCEIVYYLLFKEGKFRLGIVGGVRNGVFHSPYSAPYGGFSYVSEAVDTKYIELASLWLIRWATKKKFDAVSITIPPAFYNSSFISKEINCLWREGFEISAVDLNHYFNLDRFDEKYTESISYNGRRNLRISIQSGLKFSKSMNDNEKKIAYEIVLENRASHGFPLRMTWEQVYETAKIINADFFLVNDMEKPIAAAIVFHVTHSIVQVIYWGDRVGYSEKKPMNFLAFKLFEYYKNVGIKIIDLGPSTLNSVPNHGLCEFKESLGCTTSDKLSLIATLQ